ncbi:MAG: hypothetical protein WBI82_16250 [Sphaerochaeta sp.]|jgi:hypothetical protein
MKIYTKQEIEAVAANTNFIKRKMHMTEILCPASKNPSNNRSVLLKDCRERVS